MDDVGFVQAVLDLTGLRLGNGAAHIGRDRTGLGVRHQAAGAKHLTQTAYQAHHVGRGDQHVKINKAFVLDLCDQIGVADHHRTRLFSGLGGVALGDGDNAHVLAGAVGQHDGAAHLLVRVTAVNAQAHMQLDRFVELRLGGLAAQRQGLFGVVQFCTVDKLFAVDIMFTVIHNILLW